MFEMRYLSPEERDEYHRLFFEATHDEFGEARPTREFGPLLHKAMKEAIGSGLLWPRWLVEDIVEEGLKRRGVAWLKQSEFLNMPDGDSVVVRKSARMGILRPLDGGDRGYQQVLWSDMTTHELLQVISSARKRRKAEAFTIAMARRLLDLCEKHSCTVVSDALSREGVSLDEFLQRSA